jgi:hypothetical protein
MTIPKLVATCFGLSQPPSGQYIKSKQSNWLSIKYAPNGVPLGAYFILSQLLCVDFIYWPDDGCDKPKHVATSLGIVIYDNCCVYD